MAETSFTGEKGLDRPRVENVEFNISEINTMKEEIDFFGKNHKQQFSSILVDTHPTERSFALIFTKGLVEPEEPVAFDSLVQRGEHMLYFYQPPGANK